MNSQIFNNVNQKNDPHWIVKEFFNSIYAQGKFLWALPLIVEKKGCGINEDFCFFPDLSDHDPVYHFEGVMFGIMHDEIIITEKECNYYVQKACASFTEKHPSELSTISSILKTCILDN